MNSTADPVEVMAQVLSAEAPLKLWSFLVTCLGDVSREARVEVSGRALSGLVERVGLQPQAMRVALHRLKRDGWVESRRDGRVGLHCLSGPAMTSTRQVVDRVYGPPAPGAGWHLVALPQDTGDAMDLLPDPSAAVILSRSLALVTGLVADLPDAWLVTTPGPRGLPSWARAIVAEAACDADFAALEGALTRIGEIPDGMEDRVALRMLVLHGWRRLILRSNPAAEAILGADRAEARCRARVQTLLEALGPVPAQWCDSDQAVSS